jgi:hypothetical protein
VPLALERDARLVPDTVMREYDARFVKDKAETALAGRLKLPVEDGKLQFFHRGWEHWGNTAQHLGWRFLQTGERKYAEAARLIILAYADEHRRRAGVLRDRGGTGVQTIHATRFNSTTLSAGWFMRPLLNGYDAIRYSGVLSEADRQRVREDLLLPMAIIMRNHLIGLGNQQCVVNYTINYTGLLTDNWPLVSFAYSSKEGLRNQIRYNFSQDGFASEGHYHYAVLRPLLNQTELLHKAGLDVYDAEVKRLFDAYCQKWPLPHSHRIPLDLAAERFGDPVFSRIAEGRPPEDLRAGHLPHYGYTCLRQVWKGDLRAAAINWGHQEYRNAPDRMALEYYALGRVQSGGRAYNHSSVDQSTILVDAQNQDPRRGQVDYLDREGEVQVISASTKEDAPLYPGVKIYRTVALLNGCMLSVDATRSESDHAYDRVTYIGEPVEISAELVDGVGTLGAPGYGGLREPRTGRIEGAWHVTWEAGREHLARLTVLPAGPTKVLVGKKGRHKGPILLLRGRGKTMDWVTFMEVYPRDGQPRLSSIRRLSVEGGDGIALEMVLDSEKRRVLVNYSGGELSAAGITARERWSADQAE